MPYGYNGKILNVNLTSKLIAVEVPDESFFRKYVGGSALGMYYLLKLIKPGSDPLGPENVLVFADSVVTGAPISGLSRINVTAKSPLTGLAGDSQSGGFFPAELKFSGFDAIVITGRSDQPVYLVIKDGEAELRSAEKLWGRITKDVELAIKHELQDEATQVVQCGIAGENGVLYASIMSMSNRANGRNGLGAVMASKNLKAIAVRGKKKPEFAHREEVMRLAKWGSEHFNSSNVLSLGLLGTASIVNSQNTVGGLPTNNWRSGFFDQGSQLSGQDLEKTILRKRDTCYACTVRCKRVVSVDDEQYPVDPFYGGPEYETIATFGSYCGVADLKAVAYANQVCNMYGLDTISCGATIAWAMDCYERGILTKADTGGLDLHFGNREAICELPKMIALRQGFGELLSLGSARAAALIGNGAEDLVVAVKNQELPAHMPQIKCSLGLIYAVNPFGADHESSEHDPGYMQYPERMAEIGLSNPQPADVLNEEKVRFAWVSQQAVSFRDTVGACNFAFGAAWQLFSTSQLVEVVRAVTGWDYSMKELLEVGERRINMMRLFNAREGVGRESDTLPKKLQEPLAGGASEGVFIQNQAFEQAKDWYYGMAGWDKTTGMPSQQKLDQLGLD